jgi:hypothetical protein
MRFAVLCAALVVAPAFANDLVAYNGGDSVHLSDTPCSNAQVLDQVPPTMRSEFRAASAVLEGQSFVGCWRVMGEAAHLLYEDGDQGLIPLSVLKPDLSA